MAAGMRRNDGRREQVRGAGIGAQPGSAHQHARFLVQRAGKVEHRGSGAEALCASGCAVRSSDAAEEGEVDVLERVGANGLDEGDLVAHLVELAQRLILVQQREGGRGQRRLGKGVFQLLAQQGGGSGNCDLVHRIPFK